jgi:hypothetical protein
LRFPAWRHQFGLEQLRRVRLDHDLAFEIEPGGKAEILVRRPGIAIDAPVLATTVWVNAGIKPDVRTLIARDDAFGGIAKEFCPAPRTIFRRINIDEVDFVDVDVEFFESIS